MGSKRRLLSWLHDLFCEIEFQSVWDPFFGAGSVSYLLKAMGKRVVASDFLNFPATLAQALIVNSDRRIDAQTLGNLLEPHPCPDTFIETTWKGIFYDVSDLRFLDHISARIQGLADAQLASLAMAALLRSCLKRQPRGVFTISGDLARYHDGRRDLQLSLREHFIEQVEALNNAVFCNGQAHRAFQGDVFQTKPPSVNLVYLDPPYVPRSGDNCYIKRYHFLEGLSCYWRGQEIDYTTKVRKIKKKYTPFSYRHSALDAFERLFKLCGAAKIVMSYSSNGYPDLKTLTDLLARFKNRIRVFERPHRYHFGTHKAVRRAATLEYFILGE